jgi:acyl-CoA thioesterase-1
VIRLRGSGDPGVTPIESSPESSPVDDRPVILFVGTSLTAGLGLAEPDQAFPSLIQARIDALAWPFRVVNAGVSGDTSAGGLRRMSWLLEEPVAVLVLELGANDGLRGLDVQELEDNLQEALDLTRARYPNAALVIAGMEAPTNMGPRYRDQFRAVFPRVATENDATLIPFLLEGVGGVVELNQDDRMHPTAAGHERIAETVWSVLEPLLLERTGARTSPEGTPR